MSVLSVNKNWRHRVTKSVLIQLSPKLFIPLPHFAYLNRYILGPIRRICHPSKFLFIVLIFSLLSYSYEISATVRFVLKQNDAKYSEFGMGMNNFGLKLNCRSRSTCEGEVAGFQRQALGSQK